MPSIILMLVVESYTVYKQHKKDDDRHLVIHFVQTAQKKTM